MTLLINEKLEEVENLFIRKKKESSKIVSIELF
jgi:hypothetical protein